MRCPCGHHLILVTIFIVTMIVQDVNSVKKDGKTGRKSQGSYDLPDNSLNPTVSDDAAAIINDQEDILIIQQQQLPRKNPKFREFFSSSERPIDRIRSPLCIDDDLSTLCTDDDPSPFRTVTGQCNNLRHPNWGASHIAQRRYLPPRYDDGLGEPPGRHPQSLPTDITSTDSLTRSPDSCLPRPLPRPLPSPRELSIHFHSESDHPDSKTTLLAMHFGQFLSHDLSLAPNPINVTCCSDNQDELNKDPCFAIPLLPSDPIISLHNRTCLEFTRTVPFCPGSKFSKIREQINVLTSFVDASNVYGSDEVKNRLLRTLEKGRMKVNGSLLAGDRRALEQPGLAVMHTLFLREHNRLAEEIAKLKPQWNDEEVYQKARELVGAQMQNVVYGQYLPAMLGKNTVEDMGLGVSSYSTYDADEDPSIRNEFTTAAFRFGHTQIQGTTEMRSLQTGQVVDKFMLRETFHEPAKLYGNNGDGADEILFGSYFQGSQRSDRFFSKEVTQFLVPDAKLPRTDLVARNIQRGRDHGLASYNEFRKFCGLKPSCSWADPPAEVGAERWTRLSKLYNDTNDVELFPGGLSEVPFSGGVVGRTFNCIIGKQFKSLKDGDRFFFTHKEQTVEYDINQLDILRKRNFGDIICDNSGVPEATLDVFKKGSEVLPCANRSKLDVSLFL